MPAIVIETLQLLGTAALSKKKNAVAAKQAIEIIQNEIPTKSSEAKVSALATPDRLNKDTTARTNTLNFFIKFLFLNLI